MKNDSWIHIFHSLALSFSLSFACLLTLSRPIKVFAPSYKLIEVIGCVTHVIWLFSSCNYFHIGPGFYKGTGHAAATTTIAARQSNNHTEKQQPETNQKSISFELYTAIQLKKLHILQNLYLTMEQREEKTNNDNLKIFFVLRKRGLSISIQFDFDIIFSHESSKWTKYQILFQIILPIKLNAMAIFFPVMKTYINVSIQAVTNNRGSHTLYPLPLYSFPLLWLSLSLFLFLVKRLIKCVFEWIESVIWFSLSYSLGIPARL